MGVPALPYVLSKIRVRPTLRLLLLVDRAARTLQDLASKESVERR